MTHSKSNALNVRVSLEDRTKNAVYSAVCSHAKDPDACQNYVDRLEEASLNIQRTERCTN